MHACVLTRTYTQTSKQTFQFQETIHMPQVKKLLLSLDLTTVYLFSIGQAQNITVSIRPANNISLDVYFLMDQSFSMNDDLQNITKLASQLGMYKPNINLSLSMIVLNSRDRQGMYGMQHFCVSRNPPYKRL